MRPRKIVPCDECDHWRPISGNAALPSLGGCQKPKLFRSREGALIPWPTVTLHAYSCGRGRRRK